MNNYYPRVSYYIYITYLHEALTSVKKKDGVGYGWNYSQFIID